MHRGLGTATEMSVSHSASSLRPLVLITRSLRTSLSRNRASQRAATQLPPPTDEYALNEEPSSILELTCQLLAFVAQQVADGKDDAKGTYEHFSGF